MSPLNLLRKILPPGWRRSYHRMLAWSAMWWAGRPSRRLTVIGVTGTDGKTTTATMIADILQAAGHRVGLSSSVYYQVGEHRWLNESHLTMPGRFRLQALLRQMVKAKCDYVVLEVSSEGIRQHRHAGIDFDAAIVTNLSAEHLEAHGGFKAYRHAKGRLFERLIKSGDKRRDSRHIKRVSVVNLDDAQAEYFLRYWADEHHGVTLRTAPEPVQTKFPLVVWAANQISIAPDSSTFVVEGQTIKLGLPGRYNIANALQAIAVTRAYDIDWVAIRQALEKLRTIPGRAENIDSGRGFRVVVDYALTPAALHQFYQALREEGAKRIMAVFGAAGGGRDRWKRSELGKIAGDYASQVILTTDDPYDEDPARIAGEIAAGVPASSTAEVETILDRRAAIRKAIQLAQPGDVVAVTGMGAETSMMVRGQSVPWNDVQVVREELGQV